MSIDIERDRYGRPIIHTPNGQYAYQRVTTLAGLLEDKEGLVKWRCRKVAQGLAARQDLLDAVRAADDPELNRLCEQAADVAGASDAATRGTALHAACEAWDLTRMDEVPTELLADVEAYAQATKGLQWIDVEQFGVLDTIKVAGTWDRLVRVPDGRLLVADIKTGDITRPQKIGMQLALYARACPYNPADGTRGTPNPERGVDLTEGIVIHLQPGKGVCDLYRADLVRGWVDVQLALTVREGRRGVPRMTPWTPPALGDTHADVLVCIQQARTAEELRELWAYFQPRGEWHDTHTAAAVVRKKELTKETA